MLSDDEKKELRDMASSESLRRDFEAMRQNSRPHDPRTLDLDAYLGFLTGFGRMFPGLRSRSAPISGTFKL